MRIMIMGASAPLGHALIEAFAMRADEPFGIIRRIEHTADVEARGGHAVLVGADDDPRSLLAFLTETFTGAGALVLAAGTGDARAAGAARLFFTAGERAGVRRHVMISNWHGAADRPDFDEAAYVQAKLAAEEDLQSRDLDWTIVRTPRLTDAAGTGWARLRAATAEVATAGEIGRADVAATVAALVHEDGEAGRILDLTVD